MKTEMTEWFPVDISPVRVGWYPVKAGRNEWFCDNKTEAVVKHTRRYWNGQEWQWINGRGRMRFAAVGRKDKWRGFVEEQK